MVRPSAMSAMPCIAYRLRSRFPRSSPGTDGSALTSDSRCAMPRQVSRIASALVDSSPAINPNRGQRDLRASPPQVRHHRPGQPTDPTSEGPRRSVAYRPVATSSMRQRSHVLRQILPSSTSFRPSPELIWVSTDYPGGCTAHQRFSAPRREGRAPMPAANQQPAGGWAPALWLNRSIPAGFVRRLVGIPRGHVGLTGYRPSGHPRRPYVAMSRCQRGVALE